MPKGSVAVTFLNTYNFGSGTPVTITAAEVGMVSTMGYNVTEVFEGQFLGTFKPSSELIFRVYPVSCYMIICKILS